jgi:hypothetical protein
LRITNKPPGRTSVSMNSESAEPAQGSVAGIDEANSVASLFPGHHEAEQIDVGPMISAFGKYSASDTHSSPVEQPKERMRQASGAAAAAAAKISGYRLGAVQSTSWWLPGVSAATTFA